MKMMVTSLVQIRIYQHIVHRRENNSMFLSRHSGPCPARSPTRSRIAKRMFDECMTHDRFGDNDPHHFGAIPECMLHLFQMSTLASWSNIACELQLCTVNKF